MGQMTRKQHFVPQFLLRHFADSAEKVWVYDKEHARTFPASTENVACDGYFYDDPDLAKATGQAQYLENCLAAAERRWSAVVKLLVNRVRAGIAPGVTAYIRSTVSEMIALQMMRTPSERLDEEQIMLGIIAQLKQRGATDKELANCSPPIPADPKNWNSKGFHINSILQHNTIRHYQKIFANHIWCFLRSSGHGHFFTSDHPIGVRPHVHDTLITHIGIASPGIEIAFPLAHDVLLVMFERNHHREMANVDGMTAEAACADNILYYNSMQVESSLRFLYSRTDNFSHAEIVCTDEPKLRDPRRKLGSINGE